LIPLLSSISFDLGDPLLHSPSNFDLRENLDTSDFDNGDFLDLGGDLLLLDVGERLDLGGGDLASDLDNGDFLDLGGDLASDLDNGDFLGLGGDLLRFFRATASSSFLSFSSSMAFLLAS